VAEGPADEDLSDETLEPAVTGRQPAQRMLAQEINASTHTFQASDEERAPVLSLSPTGVAVNRVLIVGALTEAQDVGSNSEYWRGRVYAGSEPVFVYAGQYQPEAMAVLKAAKPPMYVAVVGEVRTYERGDRTNVAIEPESITEVDEATRDAWIAETANQTRKRLNAFETGDAPFDDEATVAYGEDVNAIGAVVTSTVES
jgi:RPA family protein